MRRIFAASLDTPHAVVVNTGQCALIVRALDLLEHRLIHNQSRGNAHQQSFIHTQLYQLRAARDGFDYLCGVEDLSIPLDDTDADNTNKEA